jgi:hypothetical protein
MGGASNFRSGPVHGCGNVSGKNSAAARKIILEKY